MDSIDRQTLVKLFDLMSQQIQTLQDQIKNLTNVQRMTDVQIDNQSILLNNLDKRCRTLESHTNELGIQVFGLINPPTSEDPESGMDLEPEIAWPTPRSNIDPKEIPF